MYKKVTTIVLTFLLAFTSSGIAAAKEPLKKNSTVPSQIADAVKNPSDQTSNLSPAEKRKLGYMRKPAMGIEYKTDSALWKKYDNSIYLNAPEESDPEDISKPIYDGRYYSFVSSDLIKQYDETSKITDRAKRSAARQEILNKSKGIYSYIIYRKDKLPSAEQIKKDVNMPNAIMLGEDGGYVFYFGYADYDDKDLPASDKEAFKALYDDAEVIMDTMTVFKPVSTDEGIKSLKTFKFKLKDLDGNELTESIFKNNKVTMVNIWATYCGYCIDEMPYIQELADEYKDKGFGVIGIAGDVYSNGQVDAKLLDKAKKIVKDAKVKYPSIIPDDNFKYDGVLQYLIGYPTTFFVDSEGNIVGNAIVGALSKNGYEKNILNLLNVPAEEKRKMGYVKRPTLGIEYKTDSALWKKYDNSIYLNAPEESDPEDISKPIYDGRYYSFVSSDLIKQYDETSKITDRAKRSAARQEILNKSKGIYSYIIYRKDKLPSAEQIKKDVNMPNAIMLGEDGGYVFYFGYADYDDKDLPASDKEAFKALYDDAEVIMDTMTVFKPVSTDEGIKSLKTFKFKLKDLDGNELTESIFKNNKVTMVNIWATYCGYCIDEMPYIQELADEYKDKGFGVIGIAGDVYSNGQVDAKLLDKAKKIVKDAKVKYPSIIPDDNFKYDGVLQYLIGYPTTFFVDSEGNIVGDAIIGSLTKDEFKKVIEDTLSKVK